MPSGCRSQLIRVLLGEAGRSSLYLPQSSRRAHCKSLGVYVGLVYRPSMKAVSSSETAASYPMGPTSNEMFRRVAYFVDKILKGTKQTELPIERPSHFELFVNVKTAKALGLNVPPTLLARADEVIE